MKYAQFKETLQDLGKSAGVKEHDEVRGTASKIAEQLLDRILQGYRDGIPTNFTSPIDSKTAELLCSKWNNEDREWLKAEYGCELVILNGKDYMRVINSKELQELYKNAFSEERNK